MFFLLLSLIAVIVLLTMEVNDPETKKKMHMAAVWLGLISGVLWTMMLYAVFLSQMENAISFILLLNGFTIFAVIYGITMSILEIISKSNNSGALNTS